MFEYHFFLEKKFDKCSYSLSKNFAPYKNIRSKINANIAIKNETNRKFCKESILNLEASALNPKKLKSNFNKFARTNIIIQAQTPAKAAHKNPNLPNVDLNLYDIKKAASQNTTNKIINLFLFYAP